jgi:predicted transcriptional regulator of viral defense system
MQYSLLRKLREKPFFTVKDLEALLGIQRGSARLLCHRYTKAGLFIRLKKNFYVLAEAWDAFSQEELLRVSNFLQVPSYISFTTALSFYEITTQVQRDFFESASTRRSERYNIKGVVFNYYKLQEKLYFDFVKERELFIATREKAFVDALYLHSFGKYRLDLSAINMERLDRKRIDILSARYPEKTRNVIRRICGI